MGLFMWGCLFGGAIATISITTISILLWYQKTHSAETEDITFDDATKDEEIEYKNNGQIGPIGFADPPDPINLFSEISSPLELITLKPNGDVVIRYNNLKKVMK